MKRIRWSMVLAFVAVVVVIASLYATIKAGPANESRPSDVETAKREIPAAESAVPDERAPFAPQGFVTGAGVVEPADRETRVAGQSAGRIVAIHVKERDAVEIGAPLVQLDDALERAALDAAEAEVAVASAILGRTVHNVRPEDLDALVAESAAAETRARLSADELGRSQQLAASGAITKEALDRAEQQAEADAQAFTAADARRLAAVKGGRREDVAVAYAQLKAANARRDQARAALDRLTIRAPIAGTVLQVKYRVGEYYNPAAANASSVEPLVVLGDLRATRVRMDVDERDIARVVVGAPGYVTLSAFPRHEFKGKVVEVGIRMGRKNVRTDDPVERLDVKILEVVLEIDEPRGLVPGIRVTGFIESSAKGA
jgi:multidrug resistance efflux pump